MHETIEKWITSCNWLQLTYSMLELKNITNMKIQITPLQIIIPFYA